MDKRTRKEILRAAKEKTYMGVVRITNTQTGMIFVARYTNLKNRWERLTAQLNEGRHPNARLQGDWTRYGASAFSYEILEQADTEGIDDVPWAVKQMEGPWLEKLRPYEEHGYNKSPV